MTSKGIMLLDYLGINFEVLKAEVVSRNQIKVSFNNRFAIRWHTLFKICFVYYFYPANVSKKCTSQGAPLSIGNSALCQRNFEINVCGQYRSSRTVK